MNPIMKTIQLTGIVPVITIKDAKKSVPLAHALIAGGIPCAEVTFRTSEAAEAIREIAEKVPGILVGAGTVLTKEQVDRAIDAGAKFIVSPGFNPGVVEHCIKKNIPIVPGCCTPTEMEQALERGIQIIKFFPAEQSGGLNFLRAVSSPYSTLHFIPTGGISPTNLGEYISFNRVIACGGSWMVQSDWIDQMDYDRITTECVQAAKIVKKARVGV